MQRKEVQLAKEKRGTPSKNLKKLEVFCIYLISLHSFSTQPCKFIKIWALPRPQQDLKSVSLSVKTCIVRQSVSHPSSWLNATALPGCSTQYNAGSFRPPWSPRGSHGIWHPSWLCPNSAKWTIITFSIYTSKRQNYAWSTALAPLWSLRWRAPAPIPAAGSHGAQWQKENVPLHPGAQLVLWNSDSFPGLTNSSLSADKISFFWSHFFGVERDAGIQTLSSLCCYVPQV